MSDRTDGVRISRPARDVRHTTYQATAEIAGVAATLIAQRRHDDELRCWHLYQQRWGCRWLGEPGHLRVLVYLAAHVPGSRAVKALLRAILSTARGLDAAGDLLLDAEAIGRHLGRHVEDRSTLLGWRGSRLLIDWEAARA